VKGKGNLGAYMQNRHDTPSFAVDDQILLVDRATLIALMQAIVAAYQ